jgi:hypothetical protein
VTRCQPCRIPDETHDEYVPFSVPQPPQTAL